MAAGLARRVVALVASLLLGSCSSLVAGHYTTHASFEEAYRAARVVAIVPPGVQVWEHQEGGNILHVTWSVAVSQLISRALEAEFEARGLAVVRVEERPETEPYISSVRQGFSLQLPELEKPPLWNLGMPSKELSVGNAGPLLDVSGGDLLVVVLASGVVVPDPGSEFLLTVLTLGLHSSDQDTIWLRIGLADWTGRIVCFGKADRTSASLLSKGAVAEAVGQALQWVPKRK
jgi:hypothetical protein